MSVVAADHGRQRVFASLQYPGAGRYFSGLALSMVGTWMQSIALAWLVAHELHGGGHELGLLASCQFAPTLLLGAWAGSLADRLDKRRLMLVTQAALGCAALLLAAADFTHHTSYAAVYTIAAISGTASAFDTPTRRSMIGDLVPRHALPNAMSLNTGVITSMRVVGMAIGGYVTRYFGTGWCFLANGVSYLAMIAAITGLHTRTHSTRSTKEGGGALDGLAAVWRSRLLRTTMLVTVLVSTVLFNYQLTFTLLAEQVFHRKADGLGLLFATASMGTFAGALLSARRRVPEQTLFLVGTTAAGVFAGAVAAAPSYWWCAAATVPMGVGGGLLMAQCTGLLTANVPSTMRARVLALQSVVFLGSTPIGAPLLGAVADHWGARWAMGAGAIAAVAAGAAGFAARPWVLSAPPQTDTVGEGHAHGGDASVRHEGSRRRDERLTPG